MARHEVATSPSLSGAAWLSSRFKLRASASRAFRLPSYTDIYYSSPSTLGNTNLKPESATSYEGGLDAYLRQRSACVVTVFQRRDTNVIDYVRAGRERHLPGAESAAVAFHRSRGGGGLRPAAGAAHLGQLQRAAWPVCVAGEHRHRVYVRLSGPGCGCRVARASIAKNVIGRTRIGVVNRVGSNAYAVWDASAAYSTGRVRPFLQLTNITSTVYQDIPLVAEPKRGVIGGVELYLFGCRVDPRRTMA